MPDAHEAGPDAASLPPYDVAHYLNVLQTTYVSRLRKAFAPEDFEQLFRLSGQLGLFDRPIEAIGAKWINASVGE